jgi:hypothetical protein
VPPPAAFTVLSDTTVVAQEPTGSPAWTTVFTGDGRHHADRLFSQ